MCGSKFNGAKLENAHLQDANLRDCDFSSADLTSAHFGESDCRGAIIPWKIVGENPFFRGVWVTEKEFAVIPRADKESLRLRVIAEAESASMKLLREKLLETGLLVSLFFFFLISSSKKTLSCLCYQVAKLVSLLEPRKSCAQRQLTL